MNFENLILCKYNDCDKVYDNAVLLPCANRVCQHHIDEMKNESNNSDDIQCFFCTKSKYAGKNVNQLLKRN